MSLPARIRQVLAADPDATALEFSDRVWTWRYLADTVGQLDAALSAVGPGASVGLLARNRPPHYAALIAVIATGRCVVTLSPLLADRPLAGDIAGLGLHAIVGGADDLARPGIRTAAGGAAVIQLNDDGPAVAVADRGTGAGRYRPGVAIEMLSSGTTGAPKRIPLRYASLEAAYVAAGAERGLAAGETVRLKMRPALIWSPIVHISGMYYAVDCAYTGRPAVLLERFDPERWARAVQRHQLYVAGLNPAAMRMVVDAGIAPERLASLAAVRSGTAATPPELQAAFEERFGIPVLPTYGATEFAGSVASWSLEDHRRYGQSKRGASGRPHPGIELRAVDPETGAIRPPGADGVLEVRADQIAAGHWIRTTDLAAIDEDGFLWIRGRADDAIVRGGFKVHPAKVEAALEAHPSVIEASVVGLPDPRVGAVPAAAVRLAAGVGDRPTPRELAEFARAGLAPYEMPVTIMIVDELPRTPSMKVSRPALRDLLAGEAATDRSGEEKGAG